jgi:hypothetical protein
VACGIHPKEFTLKIRYPVKSLAVALFAVGALGGCASWNNMVSSPSWMVGHRVTLTGAQEVPPVTSSATARGTVFIAPDRTVSGAIETSGITATAAHIHEGAAGANGPVIVPMVKNGDRFVFPSGAKVTEAQYDAYRAGKLYVNVHSAAHPGGELRAQLNAN